MSLSSKLKTIFRGGVPIYDLPREALRRRNAARRRSVERKSLDEINDAPARLTEPFSSLSDSELLRHFRDRKEYFFALGARDAFAKRHSELFPSETAGIIASANRIVRDSTWELAGLGEIKFTAENIWRSDPLTGVDWGLDYHADVIVYKAGGPDMRVLWELNRLGHVITLSGAYALTGDEVFADAFFTNISDWMRQNPYGRGANWNCAMEVALRSINLLAAFDIFRRSPRLTVARMAQILQLFDQHGRFILDNNEFSFISTSNHYLSNVVGLFWIGTLLPELKHAEEWKDFGLSELLREMDKQILPDGADFEASTGYHKFVTELLLYSFLLADRNEVEIDKEHWARLSQMLSYIHGITRPDGRVPLIGDADGSQIVPVLRRDADNQQYLLDIANCGGLSVSEGVTRKLDVKPSLTLRPLPAPGVVWLFGTEGVEKFAALKLDDKRASTAFPYAGAYVMRDGDLYLHFNVNDCGAKGRGSHGHNDVLSIEISAYGQPFIIDPGSYVYNLDREARQLFRSTAYHSTVMVDNEEQNTTDANFPFIMGNEASPKILAWETTPEKDRVVAEHSGYARLRAPVLHRRTVEFNKTAGYWLVEDLLDGSGEHEFSFRFHLAPDRSVLEIDRRTIQIHGNDGRSLYIRAVAIEASCEVMPAFVSRSYGSREGSLILKWDLTAVAPINARFILVPSKSNESTASRLELLNRLTDNIDN